MADQPTLISLFAGAGGLDIGLEQAGFTTLVLNEIQPYACETLRQNKILNNLTPNDFETWLSGQMQQRCHTKNSENFSLSLRKRLKKQKQDRFFLSEAKLIEGDIRKISSSKILEVADRKRGEVTLVAGGPPCQPFSRAGKRETLETDDGKLFLEFIRVVKECQPRWFLFENVKGLAQTKTIVCYDTCQDCQSKNTAPLFLTKQEEDRHISKVICANCGSQKIKTDSLNVKGGSLEIILNELERIGYSCTYKILNAADYGAPQNRERLFIVGSRDGESFHWPIPTHFNFSDKKKNAENLQLSFPLNSKELQPWLSVNDVLWKDGHIEFGSLDINTAEIWVKNVVRPHDEPVTWSLMRPSPTIGAHQAAKLALAPEGVCFEQLARQQWHTKGFRQKDMPPVFVKHAMLTDEELLQLQTFPNNWYLYGTRMERAFQIGNAVPPVLACAMGKSILNACRVHDAIEQKYFAVGA